MSLLAAAVPVAVLVLAWDESTPAVRALVEATETLTPVLDSVVVLVPAEAGEPTQEEFLPLVAEPTPPIATAGEETTHEAEADEDEAHAISPSPLATLPGFLQPEVAPLSLSALAAPPAMAPLKRAPASVVALAPPTWSAVRVLHLSRFSLAELAELSSQALPQPIWQHSSLRPVEPYLGSQAALAEDEASALAALAMTQQQAAAELLGQSAGSVLLAPTLPATPQPEQPLPALPVTAPDYLLTEPPLPALDAEADLAPVQLDELAAEALPTEAPLAEATGTAQAGWPEALASLRAPLPAEEPAPATDLEDEAAYYAATTGEQPAAAASAAPAELRPATQPFEAPNLNFQVIQYARFAVPVALAQAPFAVIYAPAWPTWLAAQELRYRTRQPLVLHVSTLAAGEQESLETATGWQAELQRQALQRADLILAETPELTRRLRHDLGLPPELVRTIPAAEADAVAQALRTAQLRPSASAS